MSAPSLYKFFHFDAVIRKKFGETRMHSSRMHTAGFYSRYKMSMLGRGLHPSKDHGTRHRDPSEGPWDQAQRLSEGPWDQAQSPAERNIGPGIQTVTSYRDPPPVKRMTHRCNTDVIIIGWRSLWEILDQPLLPPANEVCEGYVFTGVCLFTGGGVHGRRACVAEGDHVWQIL